MHSRLISYNLYRKHFLLLRVLGPKLKSFFIDDNFFVLDIEAKDLIISCFLLKNLSFFKFNSLVNIFSIDSMGLGRYFLFYNLVSTKYNTRIFLRVLVPQSMLVSSLINLFPSSNWLEREVWDFFGIFFINHGDLRRILTDYGFDGFPLRKNFPLTGFYEVQYDVDVKSVIYNFLETTQELRFYKFTTPWDRSFFF